jgi:hypothetical protein
LPGLGMNASRGVEESVRDLIILLPMADIAVGSCWKNSAMMTRKKRRGNRYRYEWIKKDKISSARIYTPWQTFQLDLQKSVISPPVSGLSPGNGHSSTSPLILSLLLFGVSELACICISVRWSGDFWWMSHGLNLMTLALNISPVTGMAYRSDDKEA